MRKVRPPGDEATVVSYGGDPASKHYTTYFRHTFEVSDPGAVAAVDLGVIRDDGVVVYVNGVEVLRDNLPSGPIIRSTRALTAVDGARGGRRRGIVPTIRVPPARGLGFEIRHKSLLGNGL